MRWYEYKMEVDQLQASDDLKARLTAMQQSAPAEKGKKAIKMPASSRKRSSWRRFAGLAACLAVVVCCGLVVRVGFIGASSSDGATYAMASVGENGFYSKGIAGAATTESYAMDSLESNSRSGNAAGGSQTLVTEDKIIYTASLSLESKDYDASRAALDEALADAGGYTESCDESSYTDSTRSVSMTLRVPEENYESFLAAAAEAGNLTNRSEQAENVTTQYMDVAARLDNLETQRARLQELEAQAETLSDLLEIEASLSDVQYQLESWQRQLDWYDNQIESCTVYVYLSEVDVYTPVQEGFLQRLGSAFGRGWTAFLNGAQNLLVGLVYAWPVVALVIIVGVVALIVRRKKHRG